MFTSGMYHSWAITYTKNSIVYYLMDVDVAENAKYVWTKKIDKARKYVTMPAAQDMAETVKKSRKKNTKTEIKILQV